MTFIDDYSRFAYLYLISEKSSILNCFKAFKTEVNNQLDLKIKVLRSDKGEEYYVGILRQKKLNPRNVLCNSVGLPDKSKGYRFYSPNLPLRIIETDLAKFIEEDDNSLSSNKESSSSWFEETRVVLPKGSVDGSFGGQAINFDDL